MPMTKGQPVTRMALGLSAMSLFAMGVALNWRVGRLLALSVLTVSWVWTGWLSRCVIKAAVCRTKPTGGKVIGPLATGFLLLSWLAFSIVFLLGFKPSTNWFVTFSGAFARGLLYAAVPFLPLSAVLKSKTGTIRPARARFLLVCKVYLVGVATLLVVAGVGR